MKQKGFTLIELLVVIAIIGILSGVVLASLNTARIKARNVQRISDMRQVALAVEFFFDDQATAGYPQQATAGALSTTLITATYLPQLPVDPVAGREQYQYRSVAPFTGYCLGTSLETPFTTPDNHRADCITGATNANVLTADLGGATAAGTINYSIGSGP